MATHANRALALAPHGALLLGSTLIHVTPTNSESGLGHGLRPEKKAEVGGASNGERWRAR
ncbi:hypothetical protein ACLOJK_028764 [Asimina triloba]